MPFSERDRKEIEREFRELRFPKSYMANLVGVSGAYLSQYIAGIRQPDDAVIRKMFCVFQIVREEYRTNGGFALDRKNMAALRKRLSEMERSIVRRAKEPDDDAKERTCVN